MFAAPGWLPFAYGAVVVWTIARQSRGDDHRPQRPPSAPGFLVIVSIGAFAVLLVGVVGLALAGRRPPGDPVDLTFPLGSGTYLVVNGGSQALTNAHLGTLKGERFARYRGQSYGVDLVRINRFGLRVPGLLPSDRTAYLIYADAVLAAIRHITINWPHRFITRSLLAIFRVQGAARTDRRRPPITFDDEHLS